MIAIDDIAFEYTQVYGDSPDPVAVSCSGVGVRYTVYQNGNQIDGYLSINIEEYKTMTYDDLIERVRQAFNETVESVK